MSPAEVPVTGGTILMFETLCSSVSAADIKRYTGCDPVLANVRNYMYILQGWPLGTHKEEMVAYARQQFEVSVQDGCSNLTCLC